MWCRVCQKYITAKTGFNCDLCKSAFCEKCSLLKPFELAALKLPRKRLMFWCFICKNNAYAAPTSRKIKPIAKVQIHDGEPGYLYAKAPENKTSTCRLPHKTPVCNHTPANCLKQEIKLALKNKGIHPLLTEYLESDEVNRVEFPVGKKRKLTRGKKSFKADNKSFKLLSAHKKNAAASWGYLQEHFSDAAIITKNAACHSAEACGREDATVQEMADKMSKMKINPCQSTEASSSGNHENDTVQVMTNKMSKMEINATKCLAEAKKKIAALSKNRSVTSIRKLKELKKEMEGLVRKAMGDYLKVCDRKPGCSVVEGCKVAAKHDISKNETNVDGAGCSGIKDRLGKVHEKLQKAKDDIMGLNDNLIVLDVAYSDSDEGTSESGTDASKAASDDESKDEEREEH